MARRLPMGARRLLFRAIHKQLGGALTLLVSAGAYLPPDLQEAWEDLGIVVLRATAPPVRSRGWQQRAGPPGVIGRTLPPVRVRLAPETSRSWSPAPR